MRLLLTCLLPMLLLCGGCRAPMPKWDFTKTFGTKRVPPPGTGTLGQPAGGTPYYNPNPQVGQVPTASGVQQAGWQQPGVAAPTAAPPATVPAVINGLPVAPPATGAQAPAGPSLPNPIPTASTPSYPLPDGTRTNAAWPAPPVTQGLRGMPVSAAAGSSAATIGPVGSTRAPSAQWQTPGTPLPVNSASVTAPSGTPTLGRTATADESWTFRSVSRSRENEPNVSGASLAGSLIEQTPVRNRDAAENMAWAE
jgi:hypothetical protein